MELIDRKALLERMRENASFATSYKPYMTKEDIAFHVLKDAKEQALRFVKDAPTVEIEALKKQIPKKPMENIMGFYCPECKRFVESVHNYCGFCGQRIEWEE